MTYLKKLLQNAVNSNDNIAVSRIENGMSSIESSSSLPNHLTARIFIAEDGTVAIRSQEQLIKFGGDFNVDNFFNEHLLS